MDNSTPNSAIESEFNELTNSLCEGSITTDERDRLEGLLKRYPALRKSYVDYMSVDTSLAWRYRTGAASTVDSSDQHDTPVVREPWHTVARRIAGKQWLTVALAVCVLLLLVPFFWADAQKSADTVAAKDADTAVPYLATLRDATDAVWNNGDVAIDVGGRIQLGTLRLDAGEAEVVFDSGAKLRIAGPAQLKLESPLVAYLEIGKVAAHMPPSAVGFELRTPTSKLVDQGTEFGVLVQDEGSTQVHVFRGQVDVHYDDPKSGGTSKLQLFDRQARRIDRPGDPGEQIAFSRSSFGGLARRVADPVQWKIAEGGNGHFYQLVVEDQPVTWHEAARLAMGRYHRGMPGHLVTLTAREEDQFVIENLLEEVAIRGVWMGLTDSLREGSFRWVTGEPFDFSNWATWPEQQPDNFHEADWHGGEDYGMYTQFLDKQPWAWNDLSIDSMHEKVSAYLVEYEPPVAALEHGSMMLDPMHWPEEAGGNGHYYRVVLVLDPHSWDDIRRIADQTEVLGTKGHLVTLETAEEREFVAEEILRICGIPEVMIGLNGSLEQNDLRWVTGEAVTGFEIERSHLPTDMVYGVFRWNPAGKWQTGWEIRAMSKDVVPAGWFGYLVEYPVNTGDKAL